MALRNIRKVGDDILRIKSKEVKVVDDKIKKLIEDMKETMKASNGCGLAAVQVGILKRIIVVEPEVDQGIYVFINPKIVKHSEEQEEGTEGCLSVEGKQAQVKRYKDITVEALDENMNNITIDASDFFARVLQHEIDHLEGVLYIDKAETNTIVDIEKE